MVKAPLEAELRNVMGSKKNRRVPSVSYLNVYGNHDLFEDLLSTGDERQIPDVVSLLGFGLPFRKKFRERFVDTGVFESLSFARTRRSLVNAGMTDPEGRYTVLAINPMVMVADHTRLGGRALPERWADILDQEYERSVGVVGRAASFNETLALTIYKEFGLEGIKKLRRSVGFAGHPAQMVKMAGRGDPDAPAVSIIDYFFAKMIKRQDRISIIWPEEGALAIPFLALAKKSRKKAFQKVSAFLTGRKMAQICADAYFYPLRADVRPRLPESLKLNWPGWEYLKENDPWLLMDELRGASTCCPKGDGH